MSSRTLVAPACIALLLSVVSAVPASAGGVGVADTPSIFVRVVNVQTGEPIAAAEVLVAFVEGDPDRPIIVGSVTNDGGHAFFTGLNPGTNFVLVRASGYIAFGDAGNGDRPPTGLRVVLGTFRGGGGESGNGPSHVVVSLTPLCADCRPGS